jgi:hypothetical protein
MQQVLHQLTTKNFNQPETPSKTTKQTQSPHSLTELKWPLSRLVSTSSTTRARNLLEANAACVAFAHFECKSALVDGIWSQCKYSPVGCFLRIKCIFVYQHAPQGEGREGGTSATRAVSQHMQRTSGVVVRLPSCLRLYSTYAAPERISAVLPDDNAAQAPQRSKRILESRVKIVG